MIEHKLKPYSEYKDSGVPWLGQIPVHWNLIKMKYLFCERSEKGFPLEPLLAATQTKGVVRKQDYENRTVLAMKDLHLLKHVCINDFVISLRSFQGGIEFARHQGIISPAYTIIYLRKPSHHQFFALLLKSKPYIESLSFFVTGIRQGQNIDYQKLRMSLLPVPTEEDQIFIVRYLNHIDRLVRRYINAKKKLIKLLNEQKQAIINKAVTRGLDPNVRLKPSGVEWLGDVPEGWEIKKLKFEVKILGGGTPSKANEEFWLGDIPWVSPKDMKTDWINDTEDHITHTAVLQSATKMIEPGAILIVVRSGILRSQIPVAINTRMVTINQDMKALLPTKSLLSEYLFFLIQGNQKTLLTEWTKQGATVESIEYEFMANTLIPVPSLNEQNKITFYINQKIKLFNQSIDNIQKEITLIQEYHTRLITDVVTGKLDVREAAQSLPEELNEIETLEQVDFVEEQELDEMDETDETDEME